MSDKPLKKPTVSVIGYEYLIEGNHSFYGDDYEDFITKGVMWNNLHGHLIEESDITVMPYTMYLVLSNGRRGSSPDVYEDEVSVSHLHQNINNALHKGRTVCILAQPRIPAPGSGNIAEIEDIYSRFSTNPARLNDYIVGHRLLTSYGVSPHLSAGITTEYKICRGEFSKYLNNFGGGCIRYDVEQVPNNILDIICKNSDSHVLGFCLSVGRGKLLYLPYLHHNKNDFEQAVEYLASSIVTYLSKVTEEEPDWVKSFIFSREKPLLEKRAVCVAEINKLNVELSPFKDLRSILWQRDLTLQKSAPKFLNEIGITTRQIEEYEEDFCVTREGTDLIIVEVKSSNSNVTRQDIGKLDDHRKAKGKPETSPALLLANTFALRQDIKEKDVRIEPNVCKRAADDHILIMRTIDLVYLYELISKNKLNVDDFITLALSESGWLKVSPEDYQIVKD